MIEIIEPGDADARARRDRLAEAGRPVIMGSATEGASDSWGGRGDRGEVAAEGADVGWRGQCRRSCVDVPSGSFAFAAASGPGPRASAWSISTWRGWDSVVDCTGVVAAIEDRLERVIRGGTFQQFGVANEDAVARFSPIRVYNQEIRIVGSMADGGRGRRP